MKNSASRWVSLLLLAAFCRYATGDEIVYDGLPADIVPLAPKALLLAASPAGDDLVAAGEYGVVVRSSDNKNWRQLPLPAQQLITEVHFVDANTGWVAGHDGLLLKTTDGGENWEFQHYTPRAEVPLVFMKMLFSDVNNGFVIGSGGNFFATRDGGATWEKRVLWNDDEFDAHLYGIVRLSDGTLMMAGEMATVYRSRDNGKTWQQKPVDYDGSFFSILGLNDDSVLVFGMRSNVYRTTDQGESWEEVDVGDSKASLVSGAQLKDGRVVLVGRSGTVLESTDMGKTFSDRSLKERVGLNAVLPWGDGYALFSDKGALGTHGIAAGQNR